VAQSGTPQGAGFEPGVLLVPDTKVLFIGAGERIIAYRLEPPMQLWDDTADTGFLGWAQHGDIILLSAELELAAWSTDGEKLWTTFVEPPWHYTVKDGSVELDIMGDKQSFSLRTRSNREVVSRLMWKFEAAVLRSDVVVYST
jgi:hypothetical protein